MNDEGDVTVYACNYCDFCCYCNASLLKHVKNVHQNNPRFIIYCNICGRSFRKWNTLQKHHQRDHPAANRMQEDFVSEIEDPFGYVDSMDDMDQSDVQLDPLWDDAHFLLRVSHEQSLSYDGVEKFCECMQHFQEILCGKIAHQVQLKLNLYNGSVLDDTISRELLSAIEVDNCFASLKSRYSREQYYEKHFNYKAPIPVLMGTEREWKLKSGQMKLEETKHYGYAIDFISSLQALLDNPAVRMEIEKPHGSTNDCMKDFCDGYSFKSHPVFRAHPRALQIILFYDDVEPANALGAKAGHHKLGCFYYTIGNIRSIFRSNLRAIQLLAVAKTHDIRTYGCSSLLNEFVKEMNLMADDKGYDIQISDGSTLTLHGAVVCMLGDTLGSNFLGGFKEGVGFSLRKCRRCLATKEVMTKKFHAKDLNMRNLESHLEYLELINNDNGGWHSTTYGINGPSLLSNLKHFDITQCLPFDVMHSIFEGVTNVHLNLLFCHMINNCQYLDLPELNHVIKSHPYGYSETDTKPVPINRESSSSFHFKQSASQMMTLMCFLPFMIGNYVPVDDEHWECFLLLWDICSMVCAYDMTSNDSVHLAWLVQTYLESFTHLYGESCITPKMHHMVHLPEQIILFGPLRNQWCMRFESKNGQMKRFISWNFKNVPLTVATYHQQWLCYNLAVRPGQETSNFLYAGDEISSGTSCEVEQKELLLQLCGETASTENLIVLRANHIKVHGTKYAAGTIIRLKKPSVIENSFADLGDFVYCYVHNIYIYKDYKVFEVEVMELLAFKDHIRAIHVAFTGQRLWCLHTDFFCHGVLHLLTKDKNIHIVDKQYYWRTVDNLHT